MSITRGIGLGVALAAVATGIWVALAAWTGWTWLLMAIVVGGCAACGVGIGNGGRGGKPAGIAAAAMTLAASLVGRFYAVKYSVEASFDEAPTMVDESVAMVGVANQVAKRKGQPTVQEATGSRADFTDETWAQAEVWWEEMTDAQRESYMTALASEAAQHREAPAELDFTGALLASVLTLRTFDFVCLGLAMSMAFGTASRRVRPEEGTEGAIVVEPSPASAAGAFGMLGRVDAARQPDSAPQRDDGRKAA